VSALVCLNQRPQPKEGRKLSRLLATFFASATQRLSEKELRHFELASQAQPQSNVCPPTLSDNRPSGIANRQSTIDHPQSTIHKRPSQTVSRTRGQCALIARLCWLQVGLPARWEPIWRWSRAGALGSSLVAVRALRSLILVVNWRPANSAHAHTLQARQAHCVLARQTVCGPKSTINIAH